MYPVPHQPKDVVRPLRRVTIGLAALFAVGMVACDSSTNLATGDSSVAAPSGPVVNQAVVYPHTGPIIFAKEDPGGDKGPKDNGKGPNNQGPDQNCTLPDSLVLDVGPQGASMSANGNSIVFPKNAVSSIVHIVMVPEVDSTVALQFYPEGIVFNPNAQPTIRINTACFGTAPSNAQIVYTDDQGNILEFKQTGHGPGGQSLSATIAHFSRYAVDW